MSSRAVSPTTRRIFLANLVAQTGIIVTGGLVRLTGSGLGCPTWPQCVPGSYTPVPYQEQAWHKYVEFGNRALTFVLVIIAVATLVAAVRHSPRRRPIIALAAVPILGTVAQAVLGGITVLTGLNPWTVAAHFLVSIALVAAATVLYYRSGEAGDGAPAATVRPPIRVMARVLVIVAALVIAIGTVVTGSGPHSGDADSLIRFPVEPRTIAWLHADLVLLYIGLLVGILVAASASDAPRKVRVTAWCAIGIAVAQGALGYGQFFAGVPWFAVAVHQLGACLVWIAVIWLLLTTRSRSS